MTLHLELDLQNVEVKRQAKHLLQRSFTSKLLPEHTNTPDGLLYLDY